MTHRWWRELLSAGGFYGVYSLIRNRFGSAGVDPDAEECTGLCETALDNAETIIDAEKAMGLFFEEAVQRAFIGADWFVWIWNIFYGSLHFVVTAAVMIFLFRRFDERYRRYRNVLASTIALGLVGFATFPLMPPRLLSASPPYGGALTRYEFVDTLIDPGGLWSFSSGTMQSISNQWAAMPSLHIGWALWCTIAVYPVLRRWWVRIAIVAYPVATMFAIVVTANHYWLDGAGGVVVLAAGYAVGNALTKLGTKVGSEPTPVPNLPH